jgi:hypothetical protein
MCPYSLCDSSYYINILMFILQIRLKQPQVNKNRVQKVFLVSRFLIYEIENHKETFYEDARWM